MKFSGYNFPQPVLGLNDDVKGDAEVESMTVDEITDAENYLLNIKYKLINPDLETLLQNKKVEFVGEITCSSTLYRRAELSGELEHQIKVAKNFVREKVEIQFLLLAKVPISNYTNSLSHVDFNGYTFDIDEGDVMGYLGETQFYAGVSYQKLKAVSSFMEVIQGEKQSGNFEIILDNPKIQIVLSIDDYKLFSNPGIGKSEKYMSVIHSSLVLPTLMHALFSIRPEISSSYTDKSWAQMIDVRMKTELRDIVFEEDNIPRIAQLLLGVPIERMFHDLNKQVTIIDE